MCTPDVATRVYAGYTCYSSFTLQRQQPSVGWCESAATNSMLSWSSSSTPVVFEASLIPTELIATVARVELVLLLRISTFSSVDLSKTTPDNATCVSVLYKHWAYYRRARKPMSHCSTFDYKQEFTFPVPPSTAAPLPSHFVPGSAHLFLFPQTLPQETNSRTCNSSEANYALLFVFFRAHLAHVIAFAMRFFLLNHSSRSHCDVRLVAISERQI